MRSELIKEKMMSNWPDKKELDQVREELSKGIASKPLPKSATKSERLKHLLCEKLIIYKQTNKLTNRKLAEIIGINEALMSQVLHYHHEKFSSDRLITYLSVVYPDFELKIELAA
jgi:predicted XRE-type DNA-binding protein